MLPLAVFFTGGKELKPILQCLIPVLCCVQCAQMSMSSNHFSRFCYALKTGSVVSHTSAMVCSVYPNVNIICFPTISADLDPAARHLRPGDHVSAEAGAHVLCVPGGGGGPHRRGGEQRAASRGGLWAASLSLAMHVRTSGPLAVCAGQVGYVYQGDGGWAGEEEGVCGEQRGRLQVWVHRSTGFIQGLLYVLWSTSCWRKKMFRSLINKIGTRIFVNTYM